MADRNSKKSSKMNTRLGTLRAELETLNSDVNKVVGDVEGIADNQVHLALRKAENVAQSAYRLAEESAAQVVHDVDDWASGKADMARKSIRAQPFSALALSAGVGALIGVMFMRR
jgi:ElaB/YqjD/DUF883 family membrane-anchored ribosome-binding protein